MSHRSVNRRSNFGLCGRPPQRPVGTLAEGQALIEYALILTLVVISLAGVLALTGPAVGQVFSHQVLNLLGGETDPRATLNPTEFWDQVGAVASFTPQSAKIATNTARPATSTPTSAGAVADTPIPTDTTVPTDTPVPTAGPSPTPTAQSYGYPFDDTGDDSDRWETGFTGPGEFAYWAAEYWNYVNSGYNNAGNCNSGNFNSAGAQADGTGVWQTTYATLDWTYSGSPGGGVADNFCARYKTTLTLDPGTYTWQIRKDDGVRIWVGGVKVVDANLPNTGDAVTWSWSPLTNTTWTRDFTVTTGGDKPIVIEMFDSGGAAELHVKLIAAASDDVGTCAWELSTASYHSSPNAWNDSPTGNYATGSRCNLKLRGDIDLTTAASAELEFWDRFTLTGGTIARAEVRQVGSTTWTPFTIHSGAGTMGWSRQVIDLTSFLGQQIELRFVLDATSATSAADGWVIDDIGVHTANANYYTVGFYDNMEGASHWYAGGTWALSSESAHQGAQAWSDSPGTNYTHGSNSVLELDGIVKLSLNPEVTDPELSFWQHYALGAGDSIRVEVSTDHQSWTTLGSVLATATTNTGWAEKVLPLSAYAGQDIYIRFRLDATTDSSVGNGWWIDDVSIRAPVNTSWALGSCDNVESAATYWVANGTWGIVNGTDTNSGTGYSIQAHSGSAYWSDSPGTSYTQAGDDALQMLPWLSLPTGTVNPELIFWHQWDLGTNDYIAVDVMRESTSSWTEVWRMSYGSMPPKYSTVDTNFNSALSWQRETVSLNSFISDTDRIKVRFRRYSDNTNTLGDGWWIDDVCFDQHTDTTRTVPFSDAMNSAVNWYAGGTWRASTEQSHDGVAFSDSPSTTYNKRANAILELRHVIDLTGTTWPTLYYWDRHDLGTNDVLKVEISVLDAATNTWGNWFEVDASAPSPQPDAWTRTGTTVSWNRHQGNLNAYAGLKIRLRFRLREIASSSPSTEVGDGWWIDQVSIVERYNHETIFPNTFSDTADLTNSWWVMDGDWYRIPGGSAGTYTNIGSGSGLGAGTWTGEYYRDTNQNAAFDDGEYRGTAQIDSIDSYVSSSSLCSPAKWTTSGHPCDVGIGNSENEYFLARWTRTITVSQATTYRLQLQSDDGLRVFVDGNQVYSYWSGRSFNTTPDTAQFSVSPGSHVIVIEYSEQTGSAQVKVDFELYSGGGVYADSPVANYLHNSNASMTLEGMIDLTGLSNPALRFSELRYRGNGDTFYIEVSTDGGYTWTSIRSYTNSQTTWTTRTQSLSAYINQRINIRFRIDARSDTAVADGWYLDSIQIVNP